ncbi:MFS transporter [Prolixibacter bellariivorans]|uniref:MFS transporter n=1 Tax=Prolixibacter bellariivorans TaxID=314319 RepID=A0A5M4B356_9BACT|nr:MFS transporter [Prolixibacter bellariivorans]GET34243.1 MFS transporter [Prolixibacter bellariivorans]
MPNYAKIPFRVDRWPFFYGWFVVLIGTLGVLFSIPGQTMGVSVFTDHLIGELNISRDQLSLAYMFGTIGSSLFLTLAGKWYDRYGVRLVMSGATITLAFALVVASFSPAIVLLGRGLTFLPLSYFAVFVMSLLFFLIRFSGQGVMTLASRNMIMKWFDRKRGLANALSSAFVSFGFSMSPLILAWGINRFEWFGTWRWLAVLLLLFAVLVLVFYRDNPEVCDLLPDGKTTRPLTEKEQIQQNRKQFTLQEARKTTAFWGVAIANTYNGFFITGLTFHILSIFKTVGMDESKALGIFLPATVISVIVSIGGNYISDFVRLKYLLLIMALGGILSSVGLIMLGDGWSYYVLILGNGIVSGIYSVLSAVAFPRFFGRKHLGAISGFNMSMIVFGSAIAPLIFSLSKTQTGSYYSAGMFSLTIAVLIFLLATRVRNPQQS